MEWSEDVKMRKFNFALPCLASFSFFPIVSACGEHVEESIISSSHMAGGIVNFGFVGGVVSTLAIGALVISIISFSKAVKK